MPLPNIISKEQSGLRLCIDLIYVNRKDLNNDLNFVMIDYLKSRKKRSIVKALSEVVIIFLTRGFILTDKYGDNESSVAEYKPLCLPARFHIVASNEHILIVERFGRIIKKHFRSTCHELPYQQYPRLMIRSLLKHVVQCLNAFPSQHLKSCHQLHH